MSIIKYAFVIPEFFGWMLEHWEIFTGIAAASAAVTVLFFYFRAIQSTQIHKIYSENIEALKSLIETRDKLIDELKATKTTAELAKSNADGANETLRSEYKIVSGIVLSELISFEAHRIRHLAELANLSSEIQIKDKQIEMLKTKLSDC